MNPDIRARLVLPDPRALKATREIKATWDPQDSKVCKVDPVPKVRTGLLGLWVHPAHVVTKVNKDLPVLKALVVNASVLVTALASKVHIQVLLSLIILPVPLLVMVHVEILSIA